ncbi:MAG: prephenate dehydrogenase/arogenate dehydrogenase family protein, partial [Aquificae bacterium]|nr:prephenate dehydrogenase/arogenate dehydrogenase family protein [Aquificota bacterium]
ASSPIVWKDIFLENKESVLHSIDSFIKSMEKMKQYIQQEDEEKLVELLSEIREKRLSLE